MERASAPAFGLYLAAQRSSERLATLRLTTARPPEASSRGSLLRLRRPVVHDSAPEHDMRHVRRVLERVGVVEDHVGHLARLEAAVIGVDLQDARRVQCDGP